jgi:nucleolar pre-ribosomal-associated protein 1
LLRNQLTFHHEQTIPSNDERLLLAQDWLSNSPGAKEVFDIWDSIQASGA